MTMITSPDRYKVIDQDTDEIVFHAKNQIVCTNFIRDHGKFFNWKTYDTQQKVYVI